MSDVFKDMEASICRMVNTANMDDEEKIAILTRVKYMFNELSNKYVLLSKNEYDYMKSVMTGEEEPPNDVKEPIVRAVIDELFDCGRIKDE